MGDSETRDSARSETIRRIEYIAGVILSLIALVLSGIRATHAGGLWRDECDSVELARLPTFVDVLHNLKFTSFPILFPTTIRLFTNLFGTSDASLRTFGFLIGVAFLLVAWFNARPNRHDVPLILPALALGARAGRCNGCGRFVADSNSHQTRRPRASGRVAGRRGDPARARMARVSGN